MNDLQANELIRLRFVKLKENVADIATKNVTGEIYESHMDTVTGERDFWLSSVDAIAKIEDETMGEFENRKGVGDQV